jgi:hypothetical protein
VLAAWPVTVAAAAECAAAWLRGWPPARLYRTAAWALAASGAWLAAVEVRTPGWRPALGTPFRAWAHGWDHLAAAGLGQAFLLLAPVALAGGLALGGLLWAWRIYAITTGLGGITASAPIIFDARQCNRQARTALGLTKAPGAVPLLARGGNIPVGGTICAIGHKWNPVLAVPAASCARPMVIVGCGPAGSPPPCRLSVPGGGPGRCWWCWTARAAATPAVKPTAPAACCTVPGPAGSRSGRMRPGCACGTSRRMSWRCCFTR